MANGNGTRNNMNGKTADILLKVLFWVVPIVFVTGGAMALVRNTAAEVAEIREQARRHESTLANHTTKIAEHTLTLQHYGRQQEEQLRILRELEKRAK